MKLVVEADFAAGIREDGAAAAQIKRILTWTQKPSLKSFEPSSAPLPDHSSAHVLQRPDAWVYPRLKQPGPVCTYSSTLEN